MIWFGKRFSFRRLADRAVELASSLAALTAAAIVLLILVFVTIEAWPALRDPGPSRFVTDRNWFPLSGQFGLLPMLTASVLTTVGAVLLAAPAGIAAALWVRFWAPPIFAWLHRRAIAILAGTPSVVFGHWGLVVLAPLIAHWGGSGQSLLTAVIVLALMTLPTIALASDAALGSIDDELVRGGAALGLGRWDIASRVVLPAARSSLLAGILLAAARAVGETMAVLMVAGNVPAFPDSLLAPVRTLTANMALEMGYASASHRSILFVSALLLMVAVAIPYLLASVARPRSDHD